MKKCTFLYIYWDINKELNEKSYPHKYTKWLWQIHFLWVPKTYAYIDMYVYIQTEPNFNSSKSVLLNWSSLRTHIIPQSLSHNPKAFLLLYLCPYVFVCLFICLFLYITKNEGECAGNKTKLRCKEKKQTIFLTTWCMTQCKWLHAYFWIAAHVENYNSRWCLRLFAEYNNEFSNMKLQRMAF